MPHKKKRSIRGKASIELLEWLWDSGITAVAGDAISWK